MKIIWTILIEIAIIIILGLIVIFSGLYNVSALNPDWGIKVWIFGTTMDNSVEHYSKGVVAPPLDDVETIKIGAEHYKDMCVDCHGAPGENPSDIAKGLNPQAPILKDAIGDLSDAELFWIIKNGIKMSGMAAFAPTHNDKQIWAMVSFVRLLPKMTPEKYQEMTGGESSESGQESAKEKE